LPADATSPGTDLSAGGGEAQPAGGVSSQPGLTSEEARLRFSRDGPNEIAAARGRTGLLRQTAQALSSPLVLLLLVAGAISIALGQIVDAGLIVAMVLLSAALNVI